MASLHNSFPASTQLNPGSLWTGQLEVAGSVILTKDSELRGSVSSQALIIEPGAKFEGRVEVKPPATSKTGFLKMRLF